MELQKINNQNKVQPVIIPDTDKKNETLNKPEESKSFSSDIIKTEKPKEGSATATIDLLSNQEQKTGINKDKKTSFFVTLPETKNNRSNGVWVPVVFIAAAVPGTLALSKFGVPFNSPKDELGRFYENEYYGHFILGNQLYRAARLIPGLNANTGLAKAGAAALAFSTEVFAGEYMENRLGMDKWSPGDVMVDGAGIMFAILDESGVLKDRVSFSIKWPVQSNYAPGCMPLDKSGMVPDFVKKAIPEVGTPHILDANIKLEGLVKEKHIASATEGLYLVVGFQHTSGISNPSNGAVFSWSTGGLENKSVLGGRFGVGYESYWPSKQAPDEGTLRLGLNKHFNNHLDAGVVAGISKQKSPSISAHVNVKI